MNQVKRIKMVKAMEYIVRQVNDEDVFMDWLSIGVADGDITYGDLAVNADDMENLDYYIANVNFADLMKYFLNIMYYARRSGGLYCDGVVSTEAVHKKDA